MRVLILDAYSAKNLGDSELVRLTVETARRTWPSAHIDVLALDPFSFDGVLEGCTLHHRLFGRDELHETSLPARAQVLFRWALNLLIMSAGGLLRTRRLSSMSLVSADRRTTLRAIRRADVAVSVGGGYLGDRYFAESCFTVWHWWLLHRSRVPVYSMPISVEARRGPMQRLLRMFNGRAVLTVRDSSSLAVVRRAGFEALTAPDLAFSHVRRSFGTGERSGIALAPIGQDYLGEEVRDSFCVALAEATLSALEPQETVEVVVMHKKLDRADIGGDELAATLIRDALQAKGVTCSLYFASSYEELVDELTPKRLLVAARMHAAIAGICAGIPTFALAYEEKHHALFRDIGLSAYCSDIPQGQRAAHQILANISVANPAEFRTAADIYAQRLQEWCDAWPPQVSDGDDDQPARGAAWPGSVA